MINEFLQYLQYEKIHSPHTVLSYHKDLEQFCVFLKINPDNFSPDKVTATHIQQWILFLMSEEINVSARTVSRKISTLKSFWHFLQSRGYTKQNPTRKIILPKTKKEIPSFFKPKEMENVLDNTLRPQNYENVQSSLIIKTFYLTGIRLSELLSIKDTDIDLDKGTLRVIGKRNKERIIPLTDEFCKEIEAFIQLRDESVDKSDPNLFLRENGKKLYPKLVYNIVHNSMSEVSSLQKRSPHVLRHTFATSILNNGADINAVKELLGHANLAATQVYTHTSFEELHNIYKQAHPRAK